MHMRILFVISFVFLINLPFGYWRANVSKFSSRWFLSVHGPVPLVIAVRLLSGLGWQLATFPFMVGAFFGGQFAGSRLHRLRKDRPGARVTSCLVWDIVKNNRSETR